MEQTTESLNDRIKRVKFNLLPKNNGNINTAKCEETSRAFSLDKQGSFLRSIQRAAELANSDLSSHSVEPTAKPDEPLDANQNDLYQSNLNTNRPADDDTQQISDFGLDRVACAPTSPSEEKREEKSEEDLLPDDAVVLLNGEQLNGEQLNESSNMSISSDESDTDFDKSNIVLKEKLSRSFPTFFNLKPSTDCSREQQSKPPKLKEDALENGIQIPGILENQTRRSTSTSDNSNLISKIESLGQAGNPSTSQADYDDDLLSYIDAEPLSEIDAFLDPDSLNQLDQEELSLLLSNASAIDIDLFLANDLLLEKELNLPEEEVQMIDQRQNAQKERMCEDSDMLMKFINLISTENGIDFKLTQKIIIDHLKGNTPVYITRYQIEELRFQRSLVGKVVKDFNDLRRAYHFKCWKKAYAMSKKNRFDQKASELFDQCLSYEKIALVYYLYYENTKCRPSSSKNDDSSDNSQNDVCYVNDELSLRILNDEQRFDSSLKSKIPNHQNSEEVLFERMIKMIGHFLSKNEKLIKYLNVIRDDVRPTLIVRPADGSSTEAIAKFDKYLAEEIVIEQMSPVEILNLVYGEDLKQIKLEFNLSKIKEGAFQSLKQQYEKANDLILKDTFYKYMWSFYFQKPLESYFRYEMKWKSKHLIAKDLQMKLKTLLYREPFSPKITMLGIEPLGTLNSEGIQYAIRQNGMIILNDYFDLKGSKPFAELFAELYRNYGFTVVVLPNVYFFTQVRCLINDVLTGPMVQVKDQIQIAEASKDNSLLETMSPSFRVEYYIDRLTDPLRQWIAYSNYMFLPDCEYFDLFKPYLNEMLNDIFRDCVSLLSVDVNTEDASMLQHVNGLNRTLADEIVSYRESNPFLNRRQIRRVKGMTDEIWHQAAGFLFIDPKTLRSRATVDRVMLESLFDVYDCTIIHPDMYQHADHVLKTFGIEKSQLGTPEAIAQCKTILANNKLEDILECLKKNDDNSINLVSVKVIFHALIRPLNFDYRITYQI